MRVGRLAGRCLRKPAKCSRIRIATSFVVWRLLPTESIANVIGIISRASSVSFDSGVLSDQPRPARRVNMLALSGQQRRARRLALRKQGALPNSQPPTLSLDPLSVMQRI